ncbi:hypothetical protein [Nocardia crassostreae]|uniref:hypothetical protein n=1 Tax=Nocardia crassostreae TaxID=53428 RepID=UPI000B15F8EE
MTGADDQQQGVDQLLLGQGRAVVLVAVRDEHAGHVVAGGLPAVHHQFAQDALHLQIIGLSLLGREGGVENAVDTGAQARVQRFGHPHQFGDDRDRQWVAVHFAQVDRLAGRGLREPVEQIGGNGLHLRPHGLGPARGEGGPHQLAQPGVVAAVGGEHIVHRHPGVEGPILAHRTGNEGGPVLAGVLGHAGITQQVVQDLLIGDRPGADSGG